MRLLILNSNILIVIVVKYLGASSLISRVCAYIREIVLRVSSAVKGLKFLILSVVFMAAGICSFLLFRPLAACLFLSLPWNAHESPSISVEERKEETHSQPSLMYDSAVRVKKIP